MNYSKFKKGFENRVNFYTVSASILAISFGIVMSSGLFIFLGISATLLMFFRYSN